MLKKIFALVILFAAVRSYAQVDLVPVDNSVYDFFRRMQVMGVLPDYNPGNIPISRESAARNLRIVETSRGKLSATDKEFLSYYRTEFSFELNGDLRNSASLFKTLRHIVSDDKQKDLYSYSDSNAVLVFDGLGSLSQRESRGDSLGRHSITLGELGFRLRGTLYNSVGFYLRASNGQKLSGDSGDVQFARHTDPKLYAQYKFSYEQNNFDTFDGYLRYRTPGEWLALMVGRNPVYQGFGFTDRLYLSDNTAAFDYLRLDLAYKAVSYTFMYGSLRGDSLGKELDAKNIATHRLDVKFADAFRMGFFESVISANTPFSFTFLNPVSFLTSAELSKSSQPGANNDNNTLLGLDMLVTPVRSLSMQASMLVDDLDFGKLFGDEEDNTSKFGWQIGALWENAFTLPNMRLTAEYTRLDPFIYSHVSNKTTYTHWELPLGHNLPPNSDEIAVGLGYDFNDRIRISLLYQHQRSANGIVTDSAGRVIVNYGGEINNASGYSRSEAEFLKGNRVDRDIFTADLSWQFIRQFYLDVHYVHRSINNIYQSRKFTDDYGFLTLRIDY